MYRCDDGCLAAPTVTGAWGRVVPRASAGSTTARGARPLRERGHFHRLARGVNMRVQRRVRGAGWAVAGMRQHRRVHGQSRGANAKCTHKVPPALGNAAGAAGRTCACVTGYNGNAETGCSITDECNVTMSHNRSAGMAHAAAWQPQWGLLFAHATWVTWAAELTILQKTRVVIFCVKSTLLFAPICRLRRWTRLQAYVRVWRGDRRRP